ncbi:metallophosphoesterase [Rhizosphaericola mali]|uniref:Metallophosphoesterase n=1 Tax=Rhizosphaericola mali TaxID=2545455 RepID=A0A5P2G2T2_9BACT|nr:metallophosphoesterase [Rhizosphaericola mali]QES89795.1 metallophosphoesterase [Rhizosphaericola mali]
MSVFGNVMRFLLRKPALAISKLFGANPKEGEVFAALDKLYSTSQNDNAENCISLNVRPNDLVVIFSDQHKGNGNGADDFVSAEKNYIAALEYYNRLDASFINLGDCEELWKFPLQSVEKGHPNAFKIEREFVQKNKLFKVFGNHDLYWSLIHNANINLKKLYYQNFPIYEAVRLNVQIEDNGRLTIFCAHGHQGDKQSDGNPLSRWFVSSVWGPLQAFLQININSPASSQWLKSVHNSIMYNWSKNKEKMILITGHTHQPVFKSLTHIERLYLQLFRAKEKNDTDAISQIMNEIPYRAKDNDILSSEFMTMKPSYFNTGCCCYSDGTITGIEIQEGKIRLVKWHYVDGVPTRTIAEEESLKNVYAEV